MNDPIVYSYNEINKLPLPAAERQAIYDGLERAWSEGREDEARLIFQIIARLCGSLVAVRDAASEGALMQQVANIDNAITDRSDGEITI